MDKCVYLHRRKDDLSVFYVGMGSISRARDKSARNYYWKNIVSKYGYFCDIVAENLSIEDAYELEMFLISELGRKDLKKGRLVNLTDGGDGCKRPNDDMVAKMIKANKPNMKPVKQYDSNGKFIARYRSISKASKETGFARQTIRDCVNGKLKTCGGYAWVDAKEDYVHDATRFDNGSESMKGGKNPNSKLVLNVETGIFYDSMSLALKSQTKYSETAFRAKLNGQNRNNTNYRYV